MIAVIDYGVANLGSMLNMLAKLGLPAERVSSPAQIARAGKLILPGVGAFDNGMAALSERGLVAPLRARVLGDKVPLLGVCLGMQLLAASSAEGRLAGLGLIEADCQRLRCRPDSRSKVPHMGWAQLRARAECPLLQGFNERTRFYFCHSYHLVCRDPADIVACASHDEEFVAMVSHGNVYGVQFHPEKSHRYGMALLEQFASL